MNYPGYPAVIPTADGKPVPSPLTKGLCIDALCDCSAFMKNVFLNQWGIIPGFHSAFFHPTIPELTEFYTSNKFKAWRDAALGTRLTDMEDTKPYTAFAGASNLVSAVGAIAVAYTLY